MLRIIQNSSGQGAKNYYSTSDYYMEGQEQELAGVWRGDAARQLGLTGKIEQKDWVALCDNRHPTRDEPLTVRRKSDRRVGYDFNFHVPKSVSLLFALCQDERIVNAFRDSVRETMETMEAEMKTRVRQKGKNEDRTTGNMVWGEFVHLTSRPVDGIPDPHLHAHCFVHNVTYDDVENRWKAGQFADLKRDAPYFEAAFHMRLSNRLRELGLPIERTKQGWEIAGLDKATLDKFSRRTALIEETAKGEGITGAKEKAELGAKTRVRKQKNLSMDELRSLWRERPDGNEQAALGRVAQTIGGRSLGEDPRAPEEAATLAVDHCFERKSVVPERELFAQALKRAVGRATIQSVEEAVGRQNLIVGERKGRRLATTHAVLAEEKRMLDFARQGRGSRRPLGNGPHTFKRDWLNADQRRAVRHVLESRDRVMLIRGAAGAGKTSMMQEAAEAIKAAGHKVHAFAPSADASREVLAKDGFPDADTVARLLKDEKLHERIRGSVIWIDEAGLMGVRTTAQLFDLVDKLDARLILSGDRRQHGSVERGAALRLLETEAGLIPAEIREILRQKNQYKQAVEALSEGRTEDGFRQFNDLGWIKQVNDSDRAKLLAKEYVATLAAKKTALVVSPTHREGNEITEAIREQLKEKGLLGREERRFTTLHNANLTQAERAEAASFEPGEVLVFHQNAKGHRKGDRIVVGDGPLPLEHAGKFTVFRPAEISLATGDVIRITHGGKTKDGQHRLNTGTLYTVKGFTPENDVRLTNGWIIDKNHGHLAHGYVVTSHASQGKTVDRVFIGQGSESFGASSREQFYVSASRGRDQVTVYTGDKNSLLDAVSRSDERLSATEFLTAREHRERTLAIWRTQPQPEPKPVTSQPKREREGPVYER